MEFLATYIIKSLILPPSGNLILGVIGLALWRRYMLTSLVLLTVALGSLYILSTPATSRILMSWLESYPALQPEDLRESDAEVIVVLGAGRYASAPEYSGDTVSTGGLERLRYAACLHKQTGLPLLVTGGDPLNEGGAEALLMEEVLLNDFQVEEVWTEGESRNTAENALFTKTLLAERGIEDVYLVTHAWHMPRAVAIFRQVGLDIIPAPTGFYSVLTQQEQGLTGWLPNATALDISRQALHELLGRLWYAIRY